MALQVEILKKVFKKIAAEQNIEDFNLDIQPLTTEGANYSSLIYKVLIKAPNHAELDLFAKVSNLSATIRAQVESDRLYETERLFFTHLVKMYEQLQDKHNIPSEDRFKIPKFYGYNSNLFEETIVLENLGTQGYTIFDRFKPVNWDYASKGVEELAKLHALSFAYKHEYPEDFANNYSSFDFVSKTSFNDLNAIYASMAQATLDVLPENLKLLIQKFLKVHWNEVAFQKYYGPGKWKVLVHADYRNSNILNKCQDGKVKSLVPIDYQTLHMGSPSTDLLYFIYSGTDEEFRRLHLKQLLNHYYGTLSKYMRLLNLDPDQVFSRKDFDEDYRDMLPHGLCTAVLVLPLVMVDPYNAPEMDAEGADFHKLNLKPTDGFKERLIPIINEFIELGVL